MSAVNREQNEGDLAAPSNLAARRAIKARASVDPDVIRRWRGAAEPAEASALPSPVTPEETAPEIEDPAEPAEPVAAAAAAKPRRSRRIVFILLGAVALAAAGWYSEHWWTVGRFMVSTDDAYVRANTTTLAAKVPGYVANILVADNTEVHAGDTVALIDDGDYKLAVESARQKVATQQAAIDRFGRQITAAQASVEQAEAQLVSAQAGAKRAQLEQDRQHALAAKEFASRQALEQANANRDQGVAAVKNAEAALDAAKVNIDVLKAQQQEAARTLDELKTAQAKAERDLSFTRIVAPVDGMIGNRAMQPGDFVQTGQRLASLVPLNEVYIDANFKETQLANLKPGQQVDISVDAVPGRTFPGTVTSMSPASGSVFSLLPPDNATGNFTKIVQRLPVRIRVPLDVTSQQVMRPGMSVVVSVDTRHTGAAPKPVAVGAASFPQVVAN